MRCKKEKLLVILAMLMLALVMSACGHEHVWQDATCTQPLTCIECEEVAGNPLGHVWKAATCKTPATCGVCGEINGVPLEHKWEEATCTTAKSCSVCGETEGVALEHQWLEATCTEPGICLKCGVQSGRATGHHLSADGMCVSCYEQVGFQLNKANYLSYLKFSFEKTNKGFVASVEPIANVEFCNVVITCATTLTTNIKSKYAKINGKTGMLTRDGYLHELKSNETYTITLDSQGYGSYSGYANEINEEGLTVTSRSFSNEGITQIEGYIVE